MMSRSTYEDSLVANVKKHGWQFTYVFDPDSKDPEFGYSIGFAETLGAPEFIVFGLPKGLIHKMLAEVYRQIKAGIAPTDGKRWSGILEGFECVGRKAVRGDVLSDYAVSSQWYWAKTGRQGAVEVYQLIWPGAQDGLFPWDTGCAEDVIEAQPALWIKD